MSSYPGGKSGAGIYQRLINLIPRHGILVVPFAGHCGVVRNIRPAEHTIVIDRDPAVCQSLKQLIERRLMKVRYTTSNLTGRVAKLTLEPDGAADELFLGDLVHSFKEGTDVELTGKNGVIRVFTPGSNEKPLDNGNNHE